MIMNSHELARKLLELPCCSIVKGMYRGKANLYIDNAYVSSSRMIILCNKNDKEPMYVGDLPNK